jgi:putative membrane protein
MKRLPGIYARGMAMGVADVVPGVSGGTLALITGIYEELIRSLAAVHPRLLRVWYQQGFMAFWHAGNFGFLVSLFAGILTSIALFARLIGWLLTAYPVPLWAFFCGLIAASVVPVWRSLGQHRACEFLALLVGMAAAAWVVFLPGLTQISLSPMVFLLSGAVAICAMILPGISGSFILLLLGMYVPVLDAVRGGDWVNIVFFVSGCALGLLSFVHLLRWVLQRWHDPVMALLAGFMAGSLVKLWPWRFAAEDAAREQWLWPAQYAQLQGAAMVPQATLALFAGMLVVVMLARMDRRERVRPQ